jgi:hypothetical protein
LRCKLGIRCVHELKFPQTRLQFDFRNTDAGDIRGTLVRLPGLGHPNLGEAANYWP